MKKVICDYCNKESDNITKYVLPDYVTYEVKDSKGNIVYKFANNKTEYGFLLIFSVNCPPSSNPT